MPRLKEETQEQRETRLARMRAYRASPEGSIISKEAKRRRYATPEGHAVRQEGNRRWKKSENGKSYNREWAKKRYEPRPARPLFSPEERKARAKASYLKSISRPGYKEKSDLTNLRYLLKTKYGITLDEFNRMAAVGCNICGSMVSKSKKKRMHVDHCHATGRVRGVLCDPCNRGLGCFEDDLERLAKAITYLGRP